MSNNSIQKILLKHNLEQISQHGQPFLPLDSEIRLVIPTATAAHHLNRSAQTLRTWACLENGPIRPFRISGRLAWPVADIRKLLKQEAV